MFFKNVQIPASFCFYFDLFSSKFKYKLKKHRCCAWGSNPGPQDVRRRRLPTLTIFLFCLNPFVSFVLSFSANWSFDVKRPSHQSSMFWEFWEFLQLHNERRKDWSENPNQTKTVLGTGLPYRTTHKSREHSLQKEVQLYVWSLAVRV